MTMSVRRLAPVAVATVLATGGYAFLAGSSTPHTNAGFAQTDIEGYAATNVHYTLGGPGATDDPDNKSFVRTASFDYKAENRGFNQSTYPQPTVYASIRKGSPDGGYVACTGTAWNTTTGVGSFSCDFSAQNLRFDSSDSALRISGAQ